MMTRALKYAISYSLAFAFMGCTFPVHVDPRPQVQLSREKYRRTLAVYIDDAQLNKVYQRRGFLFVGWAHSWEVHVGEALQRTTVNGFSQLFDKVEIVKSPADFQKDGLNVIFAPSIEQFEISQDIKTHFVLRATLQQGKQVLYKNVFFASTPGTEPLTAVLCLGVFGGDPAFSLSVRLAFEKVFEELILDLQKSVDLDNPHQESN